MEQGKKAYNNSKPKFAKVVIGDSETKENVWLRMVAPPAILI